MAWLKRTIPRTIEFWLRAERFGLLRSHYIEKALINNGKINVLWPFSEVFGLYKSGDQVHHSGVNLGTDDAVSIWPFAAMSPAIAALPPHRLMV